MKNTFGNALSVTLFGESHGKAIGAVLDGLAPGITIDEEYIKKELKKRRPQSGIGTARREDDSFEIPSGVFAGKTTGAPLMIIIENKNISSKDYDAMRSVARPGHCDYAAYCKYHGYEDYRGGGHFSGRLTAALVAAGAIARYALSEKRIEIGTHIAALGREKDRTWEDLEKDVAFLSEDRFPVLDKSAEERMRGEILAAAAERDSIGGILESVVTGMPAGVGEPFFDSVESMLSHALFAIPGIKGVQFGDGFDLVCGKGSEFNDALRIKDGKIVTETNSNGGINGGITNGMPILFRCAVKPTPSIYKAQKTVDFLEYKERELTIEGRHDPSIVPRARAVVDAVTALVIYDLLADRFGTDYFGE